MNCWKCCCLGYNNNNYNVESTLLVTSVEWNVPTLECIVILPQEEEDGLSFSGEKLEGWNLKKKKDWVEYENGFGDLRGEFWLGLTYLHCTTKDEKWKLRIDLHLSNGTKLYLHYKKFAVGPAEDQYPLTISGFDSVGPTDPFSVAGSPLNGMLFST